MTGPSLRVRVARLARQDQKAGGVVLGVLDVRAQDLAGRRSRRRAARRSRPGSGRRPRRCRRPHRRCRPRPGRGSRAGAGSRGTGRCAWTWLSTSLDRLQRGAGHAQELVVHAHELLADDVQAAARQQVVDVGDAAGDRVVDRDHGVARLALAHGGEGVLERVAGQGVELGEGLRGRRGASRRRARPGRRWCAAGRWRSAVGAHAPASRMRRAFSRSAGVSTPNGTASTSAHADAHAVLQRAQLLQPLALLERARRQGGEALQRVAA